MKTPKYLVQYYPLGTDTRIPKLHPWDGVSALSIGHPTRYVIESKPDRILVRDFEQNFGKKTPLTQFAVTLKNLTGGSSSDLLSLNSNQPHAIRIVALNRVKPVDEHLASQAKPMVLPPLKNVLPEDVSYQKILRNVLGGAIFFSFLILIFKPSAPEIKDEELVPKKFAKILLNKPKDIQNAPASGASNAGATAKTVAKALQSKTAQQTLRNILKGGLSKYSLMATGKSIQNLNQSILAQATAKGASLQNKANAMLAKNESGTIKVGTGSGYSIGSGANIAGQGQGSASVGLDSAEATVDEGLTKEEVAKVIHSHLSEIRYCYESAIVKDPTLAGKVIVDFKIGGKGMIDTARVAEATLSNPMVGSCLIGKMKKWKFPNPRGGVTVAVSYPFVFKSLAR